MNFEQPKNAAKEDVMKRASQAEVTRRAVVGGLGLASVMGALKTTEAIVGSQTSPELIIEIEGENFEREFSHNFGKELKGYMTFYEEVKLDEVLFVDETGVPIGGPIKIAPFEGIEPGEIDIASGTLKGDLNQDWLDALRRKICAENPGVTCDIKKSLPRQMNLIHLSRELANADYLKGENIEADTYLGVVRHFSEKRVIGHPDETRVSYLQNYIAESADALPAGVREELGFVVAGLAAQESKYINDARSGVGAMGIMQFMPDTWAQLGYKPEDILQFTSQVEGAGEFFSRAYQFIKDHDKGALDKIQETFFPDDEVSFERYFLTPVLINSYNSGPGRLVMVLREFLEEYPTKEKFERERGEYPDGIGYDAYLALTKVASAKNNQGNRRVPGYGSDSSQYVLRSYALARLLAGEKASEVSV